MTKIFMFSIFFISFQLLKGQDLFEKLAQESCECLSGKSVEGLTQDEKEMQVGVCILTSLTKHKKEFDKYSKGKSLDELDMEKFGEDVGIRMATICPMLIMDYADMNSMSQEDDTEIELGKIIGIEHKQFSIVNLEAGDGSILKFLWLWDFPGSDLLKNETYKDKWINIRYKNYSIYNAEKNDYIPYKIIEGMELGE